MLENILWPNYSISWGWNRIVILNLAQSEENPSTKDNSVLILIRGAIMYISSCDCDQSKSGVESVPLLERGLREEDTYIDLNAK